MSLDTSPPCFADWMKTNHTESAKDIANHRAGCGYHGLTRNADIDALFEAYEGDIFDEVSSLYDGDIEVLGGFMEYAKRQGCGTRPSDYIQFLVWSAAELCASKLVAGDA